MIPNSFSPTGVDHLVYNNTLTSSTQSSPALSSEELDFLKDALGMNKTCMDCQSTSVSKWYKKQSPIAGAPPQDQCNRCYRAARRSLARSGSLEKICADCQSTFTSNWYKKQSPIAGTPPQDQCDKCYQAAMRALKKQRNNDFDALSTQGGCS